MAHQMRCAGDGAGSVGTFSLAPAGAATKPAVHTAPSMPGGSCGCLVRQCDDQAVACGADSAAPQYIVTRAGGVVCCVVFDVTS